MEEKKTEQQSSENCTGMESKLYCFGGDENRTVSCMSLSTRKWNQITAIDNRPTLADFGGALIGHTVYVCGGTRTPFRPSRYWDPWESQLYYEYLNKPTLNS